MRILLTGVILILTNILFISCDSSVDPLLPNNESGITDLQKIDSFIDLPIQLPQRSPAFKDSVYSISVEIDGSIGGQINYENYYISTEGDSVTFYFDLYIPKNAFQGTETITATYDSTLAAIHFTPSMTFDSSLHLFLGYKGLDLSGMQTGTIDFVYTRDDGTVELVVKMESR